MTILHPPFLSPAIVLLLAACGEPLVAAPPQTPPAPLAADTATSTLPVPPTPPPPPATEVNADHASVLLPSAAVTTASVVRGVVQGSDLPLDSRARIEFRIGPSGQVLDHRVVAINGGSPDFWDRAARAAVAQLATRGLVMTGEYTHGATVTVDISSRMAPSDPSNRGAHAPRRVRTSFQITPAP